MRAPTAITIHPREPTGKLADRRRRDLSSAPEECHRCTGEADWELTMDHQAAGTHPFRLCAAAAAGVAAGVLVAAAPAAASEVLTFSPSAVRAGDAVVISGSVPTTGSDSCPARRDVVLTSTPGFFPPHGTGAQAVRTASGSFRVRYNVPATAVAGTYGIGVRCGSGDVVGYGRLQVTDAVKHVPAGGNTTPDTGRWLIGMGALLIGAGIYIGVAELSSRARRQ
ncbi:hypothetical protein COUCH_15640 [Couchioplanes caeruleus]|uniref:hypothetical protein n=1 Tax=Couchioplanes caeruleus TaxID=56438 RepID=UPI0020BE9066|nr:hypothetical protein [Couchioplanes caeruleus]UQU67612.1 hypothetical protein COUCH_15640 [Couchioplanes caeruleus]